MAKERKLTIRGRYENVPKVAQLVAKAASEAGLDEKGIFHCQMAADEACTNIIEHAYGGEDKGDIYVTVLSEPGVCTITMIDTGAPFDPDSVPKPQIDPDPAKMKPGGLGLYLMRELMDEVTFTFGEGQNKLVMVKRRAGEADVGSVRARKKKAR